MVSAERAQHEDGAAYNGKVDFADDDAGGRAGGPEEIGSVEIGHQSPDADGGENDGARGDGENTRQGDLGAGVDLEVHYHGQR